MIVIYGFCLLASLERCMMNQVPYQAELKGSRGEICEIVVMGGINAPWPKSSWFRAYIPCGMSVQ